jgi:hypothetical protein
MANNPLPIAAPPPNNNLSAIQQKVRRLTRSPSEAQLTTDDLNNYINTFIVYDFPESIRTFNLHQEFSFWCNPYQDAYPTQPGSFGAASAANQNLLYNFSNLYLSIDTPIYIAGYQVFYTQSREQFYGIYPELVSQASIGPTGDGVTVSFTGVVTNSQGAILSPGINQQITLVKGKVLFESVDVNGNGASMVDVPVLDATTGNPTIYGNLYAPNTAAYTDALANPPLATVPYLTTGGVFSNNYINYVTGQYVVTFPVAPASGAQINSQTVPQVVTIPQALLWYNNTFYLRPVPDQPYEVNMQVFVRPTQLLANNASPQLEEWWQYIAYGAAKKIFEDRMDLDSVQMIMPEFTKQERLCLRRTIVQITLERSGTIYTEQTGAPGGQTGSWGFGSSNF